MIRVVGIIERLCLWFLLGWDEIYEDEQRKPSKQ